MIPLVPHPSTPEAALGVAAGVERGASGMLRFAYRVVGALETMRLPAPAPPGRGDRLWERTCFEAFVAVEGEAGYVELNVAPSGAWAVYGFARYRERSAVAPEAVPRVEVARGEDALDVVATVPFGAAAVRVGLSAVVERMNGRRSYWALRHPAAAPDFHHADGFTIRLP